jgi:hypothetical protein
MRIKTTTRLQEYAKAIEESRVYTELRGVHACHGRRRSKKGPSHTDWPFSAGAAVAVRIPYLPDYKDPGFPC